MNNRYKTLSDKSLEKVGGGMINPFSISINDTEKIEKYWGSVEKYKESLSRNSGFIGFNEKGFPTYKN